MTMEIAADKNSAIIDGEKIVVNQPIDINGEKMLIEEFRLIDPLDMRSVWMKCNGDWYSCKNWKEKTATVYPVTGNTERYMDRKHLPGNDNLVEEVKDPKDDLPW